ncbi:hypothetical protein ACP70R_044379 [Stipagrostis hirtigluma subsp. patula]
MELFEQKQGSREAGGSGKVYERKAKRTQIKQEELAEEMCEIWLKPACAEI